MFSNTQLKFVSNSKLFQLAKENRERNNIEHKNYFLKKQIEIFFFGYNIIFYIN